MTTTASSPLSNDDHHNPPPPRTLDTTLPPPLPKKPNISTTTTPPPPPPSNINLPLPYTIIPPTASNLNECARYQIHQLESQLLSSDDDVDVSSSIEDALDDGFVLCDLSVIRRKLRAWRRMFPRVKPFFALKCHPDVMVAAVLGTYHPLECGFDCASLSEIRLALTSSPSPASRRCLYANPQRSLPELRAALDLSVKALTFDGIEELVKIASLSSSQQDDNDDDDDSPPEVMLRLLVPDAHSSVPLGEKFGAPPENVRQLATKACELGLPLIGASFHCGSGCHDPRAYEMAIRMAKEAMDVMDEVLLEMNARGRGGGGGGVARCQVLDIGGGYPGVDGNGADEGRFAGRWDTTATTETKTTTTAETRTNDEDKTVDIARVVTPLLDELFPKETCSHVSIVAEPGRYFVEEAFALCTRIYSTKVETGDDGKETRHYYIAHGVQGLFKDVILCQETFIPIPLPMNRDALSLSEEDKEEPLVRSIVHGPSGEVFDVVCRDCLLPVLTEGDWLLFDRMGAYTLSIAPRSGKVPIRYVIGAGWEEDM